MIDKISESVSDDPSDTESLSTEVKDYIDRYQDLYNLIKKAGMRWMTISPRPSAEAPFKGSSQWALRWLDYCVTFTDQYIFVFEIAFSRLHMHIVYSCKDKVKEYIFINYVRNGLPPRETLFIKKYGKDTCLPAQIRVYNGEPKGGIAYLFKDVMSTIEYGILIPVLSKYRF